MEPQVHHPDNVQQPQPAPQPQPAYHPPTPVTTMAQPATATTGSSDYHSNPFTASLSQLSIILKANPVSTLTLGLFMILVIFTGGLASGLLTAFVHGIVGNLLIILIVIIFYFIVLLRFLAASLYIHAASRSGQTLTAREAVRAVVKQNYSKFWFTTLVAGLLVGIGFIALVIPGLFLMGRLMLAPYIAMNEGLGVKAALKRSMKLTKGHWFEVISAALAQTLLIPNGLLAFVGAQSGVASRYFELTELEKSGAPKPKTHWLNIALPVLIIAAIALYIGFFASLLSSSSKKSVCTSDYSLTSGQSLCNGTGTFKNIDTTNPYNTNPYNYTLPQ